MRSVFLPLLALAVALGACREDRSAQAAAEEIATLSRDLCIDGWLSDPQRTRLVERARLGRLTSAEIRGYVGALRAYMREAEARNTDDETFCRAQRNLWRAHFMR